MRFGNVSPISAPRSAGTTTAIPHMVTGRPREMTIRSGLCQEREPIKDNGGGPGLLERAERLGSVGVEVLGELSAWLGQQCQVGGQQVGCRRVLALLLQAVPQEPVRHRPGRAAPVRTRVEAWRAWHRARDDLE